jgi:membrane protein DedA with SNARE-associated domain
MEYFRGLPYPVAVAALFVIVLLRAGATYGLARGLQAGASRTRLRSAMESPKFDRARELVERWGAPVVALSFLTVGFQTVANLAAGAARMSLRRYVPALLVGGLAWAVLYATLGVIGFAGFSKLYALSAPAAILLVAGIVLALLVFAAVQRRRRQRRKAQDDHDDQHDDNPDRLATHHRFS